MPVYCDWLYITAVMPQGSPQGLLSFLLLIDDLTVDCLTHKYVDDTMHTLIESVPCGSQQTHMQTFLQQLQTWATPNKMKINFIKTKEMIVERVQHFKLVGITISHDMNRQLIIEAILDNINSFIMDVSTKYSSVVCNCVKVQ